MKFFCSLSDYNYLPKGLVLYDSLVKTSSENFYLFYLCLDREAFDYLNKLIEQPDFFKIVPIYIGDLETEREDLKRAKGDRLPHEYCWTLASYLSDYLLETYGLDHITYIDADIEFYADVDIMYREIGTKSVGIIAHRHNKVGDTDGAYNVGIIYFKNDKNGRDALSWWADAVLNKKYPKLQTCGDQKYLEEFIPLFGVENVCVADNTFGHGAPWNYRLYDWSKISEGKINWNGKEQIFLFNHFSRMSYDLNTGWINWTSGFYGDHVKNGSLFNEVPQLPQLYNDYFSKLKDKHKKMAKLKIAFGMIVLNGDYVLKQCLEVIYPFASQILIAEGPVTFWKNKGLTTSTDKTNSILDSFPDPEKKISIVHGQYSEKDEQCQAYMKMMKPDTDYLWMVDSDELYKAQDIKLVTNLLIKEKYTSVGVRSCSFYGPFERYLTGFEEQQDQFLRIFKVYPGSYWKTHRPPTMAHVQQNILTHKHLDSETLYSLYGVRMYHYSYVFPRQIKSKMEYYQSLAAGKFIDNYFDDVYSPWVVGDDHKKKEIENKYTGVHEYRPEYRGPSFTAPFIGEHPDPIKRDMDLLMQEWKRQLNNQEFSHINSWKNREVFKKQLALNIEELNNFYKFVPFHLGDFLHFVTSIRDAGSSCRLLDVGCGVGSYYELCRYFAPWVRYKGIDFAQEAVDIARGQWAGIDVGCRDYKSLKREDFKDIDIMHACSLHNVLPNGQECMDFLLSLGAKYIILGKVFTTSKEDYYTTYKAYDLIETYKYYHNYKNMLNFFVNHGYNIEEEIKHDDSSNFLLRLKNV